MEKSSINKTIIVGRLGNDPESRYTASGRSVSSFSVATDEYWVDNENQKKNHTEWHNMIAWDKLSDFSNKFLFKGQLVYFEGKLRTKSWDDKNGTKKYKTEIFCSQITPLEWKKSS
ncbi:MAG: single-stranded DNA-binding protein [Candidatus Marinimicrobia bacterium]|nr:single-stranded DNA-binding protein [Candidatus Neomarinimicrobiota bacterium]